MHLDIFPRANSNERVEKCESTSGPELREEARSLTRQLEDFLRAALESSSITCSETYDFLEALPLAEKLVSICQRREDVF